MSQKTVVVTMDALAKVFNLALEVPPRDLDKGDPEALRAIEAALDAAGWDGE